MIREVKTTLDNILSLVNCAEDYGFQKRILMGAFAEMTGWVSNEEIKAFADDFLTEEAQKAGYSEEDGEAATARLTEWREHYMKPPSPETKD